MSLDTALRNVATWFVVIIVPVVAVIAVSLTGFGSAGNGSGTAGPADTVVIKNFAFAPDSIRVKVGTTMTVVNDDHTTHTFTADTRAFDTGDLGAGQRSRVSLDRAGTYAYHCEIHPFMTGTVRVSR